MRVGSMLVSHLVEAIILMDWLKMGSTVIVKQVLFTYATDAVFTFDLV